MIGKELEGGVSSSADAATAMLSDNSEQHRHILGASSTLRMMENLAEKQESAYE
jgi:hypothetical protein